MFRYEFRRGFAAGQGLFNRFLKHSERSSPVGPQLASPRFSEGGFLSKEQRPSAHVAAAETAFYERDLPFKHDMDAHQARKVHFRFSQGEEAKYLSAVRDTLNILEKYSAFYQLTEDQITLLQSFKHSRIMELISEVIDKIYEQSIARLQTTDPATHQAYMKLLDEQAQIQANRSYSLFVQCKLDNPDLSIVEKVAMSRRMRIPESDYELINGYFLAMRRSEVLSLGFKINTLLADAIKDDIQLETLDNARQIYDKIHHLFVHQNFALHRKLTHEYLKLLSMSEIANQFRRYKMRALTRAFCGGAADFEEQNKKLLAIYDQKHLVNFFTKAHQQDLLRDLLVSYHADADEAQESLSMYTLCRFQDVMGAMMPSLYFTNQAKAYHAIHQAGISAWTASLSGEVQPSKSAVVLDSDCLQRAFYSHGHANVHDDGDRDGGENQETMGEATNAASYLSNKDLIKVVGQRKLTQWDQLRREQGFLYTDKDFYVYMRKSLGAVNQHLKTLSTTNPRHFIHWQQEICGDVKATPANCGQTLDTINCRSKHQGYHCFKTHFVPKSKELHVYHTFLNNN